MILTYAVGGLLLAYFLLTAITYARFHWCKNVRLSALASDKYTGDGLNLVQADAFFQKGLFFHEKGLFSPAISAYEQCLTMDDSHPMARQYHEYAAIGKPSPSLVVEKENSTTSEASQEISPLQSFLKRDLDSQKCEATDAPYPIEINTLETINDSGLNFTDEFPPDLFLSPTADMQPVPGDDKKAQAFYNNGQTLSAQEIWPEAIAEYTKAIEADPHFIKAYASRSSVLMKVRRVDEAVSDYSKLIQLEPQNSLFYYKRGNAFLHTKKLGEAISDYSAALEISPNNAKILNRRGTAYFRNHLFNLAAADFTRAIILTPDFAEAYSNRGIVRNQMGQQDGAQKDFIKAESIKQKGQKVEGGTDSHVELPEEIKKVFDVAMLALQNGDESTALVKFNGVISAEPAHPTAYFQRANIHLDNRRLENAIADFSAAIECKPDFGEAYSKRGQANILSNLYIDAIDDFNKAIELLPDHLASYLNRGRANSQRGLREEAIADFSKAIEIDPKSDVAYYNRGLELQNVGDYNNAMKDLNHACELGNNAACVAYINMQASV